MSAKNPKFFIDFSKPAGDGVFDGPAFEKFLHDRIKVEGRAGQLGDKIKIESEGEFAFLSKTLQPVYCPNPQRHISLLGTHKLSVSSTIPFSKRYLKYLTKKFLKKHQIRNYIRYAYLSSQPDHGHILTCNFSFSQGDLLQQEHLRAQVLLG